MKHALLAVPLGAFLLSVCSASPRVAARDGWLYVDGEKFFIKGICYFELRGVQGQVLMNPPEMMDRDFRLMKEAGFNTVKSLLTPEQIALAGKHGLMVVQHATRSCFSKDYRNPELIAQWNQQADEFVGFSRKQDHVLYYVMDNEPSVPDVFLQGAPAMENVWRLLNHRIKRLQPDALTSVQMMPPSAFADVSMCDVASLNLYPFHPAHNSIGYRAYADGYRRRKAGSRPFVFSEYGWTGHLAEFGPRMMELLDEQIAAGASGSFLFTWRSGGKEKDSDNLWWGIVPNHGEFEDWRKDPRPIFDDYKRYFEAVVIERGAEAAKLWFQE